MTSKTFSVIISDGRSECHAIPTIRVHHRDFPEFWAEGNTAAEGAQNLINHLVRARAGVGSSWRRDPIDRAIHDVTEFFHSLEDPGGRIPIEPSQTAMSMGPSRSSV